MGGTFKKGVSSQPAEGVQVCLWESPSGTKNFVGIITFESAKVVPGGLRRLAKNTWTEADYQPFWDLLGVEAPVMGDPGWASYGCWVPAPGGRNEAVAILLYVLDHNLTDSQVNSVFELMNRVQTACTVGTA
jgi:hypothetical protein